METVDTTDTRIEELEDELRRLRALQDQRRARKRECETQRRRDAIEVRRQRKEGPPQTKRRWRTRAEVWARIKEIERDTASAAHSGAVHGRQGPDQAVS